MGVRMASIFALAKEFTEIPLNEIEKLLDSDYYEIRIGAVGIMDLRQETKRFQQIIVRSFTNSI